MEKTNCNQLLNDILSQVKSKNPKETKVRDEDFYYYGLVIKLEFLDNEIKFGIGEKAKNDKKELGCCYTYSSVNISLSDFTLLVGNLGTYFLFDKPNNADPYIENLSYMDRYCQNKTSNWNENGEYEYSAMIKLCISYPYQNDPSQYDFLDIEIIGPIQQLLAINTIFKNQIRLIDTKADCLIEVEVEEDMKNLTREQLYTILDGLDVNSISRILLKYLSARCLKICINKLSDDKVKLKLEQ